MIPGLGHIWWSNLILSNGWIVRNFCLDVVSFWVGLAYDFYWNPVLPAVAAVRPEPCEWPGFTGPHMT